MPPLYLDNSTFRAVATCDTQAVLRYHLGLTVPVVRPELQAGISIHEMLACWARGGSLSECLTLFESVYRPYAESQPTIKPNLAWPNLSRLASRWLDTHALASFPVAIVPTMVEVGAQALLTPEGQCICGHPESEHGGIRLGVTCAWATEENCACATRGFTPIIFVGRLDAAGPLRNGAGWAVIDHKSTATDASSWSTKWSLDSQFMGYHWLARQHFAEPVKGIVINVFPTKLIPGSSSKCRTHGVPYAECGLEHAIPRTISTYVPIEHTDAQLDAWRTTALELAARYCRLTQGTTTLQHVEPVAVQGQFTGACQWCESARYCRSGKDADVAAGLFVTDPWRPYDRIAPAKEG